MLVKWIVCIVAAERRAAFARAQEAWSALAGVDGFVGQVGGWCRDAPHEACLCAFWSDADAYRCFMAEVHDAIYEPSGQGGTYQAIATAVFDVRLSVGDSPGARHLQRARGLRVADCTLRPGRTDHFEEVQQAVWIPAMASASGMLAGAFSRARDAADHYLVTTLWDGAEAHDSYARDQVPSLRAAAAIDDDVASLRGRFVELESAWTVVGD